LSIDVGKAIGYLDLDTSGFKRGFKSALQDLRAFNDSSATTQTKVGSLGSAFKSIGSSMTKYLTVPIAGAGAAVVGVAAKFESAMSEVAAISGATGEDFQALTDKAKEMGATTKFSASESAAALKYMAMAGWDTNDMLNGLDGVMQLAAASGEDLASTSDIVTDAMTAFGLSADQSTRFADVLAQTANRSNTSVALMGETFKYVAPVAGALGYSIEDASVAIGLMANSGIKGSQAGTSLKNVLTNLAKPTDQVQAYMDKLNISLTDSAGNVKPLNKLLNEMRDGFNGLTEAEKAEYAAGIAGKEGMSGLLAIVNASQTDFDNLTESINNSSGAAKNVSDVMMDNLGGQLTILKSTLESIAISFGDILLPVVKKVVSKLQEFADKINNLDESQKQTIVRIVEVVASIGPVLLVLGKLFTAVSSVMNIASTAKTVFSTLGTVISGIGAPILAIIAVIGTLVAAFKHLWDTNEEFRASITAIWDGIKTKFEEFGQGIVDRLNELGFSFKDITEVLSAIWNGFCDALAPVFEAAFGVISSVLGTVLDVLTGLFDVFAGIFTGDWNRVWNGIKEVFSGIWNGIKGIFSSVLGAIKGVVNTFLGWFGTSWDTLWTDVKNFFSNTWDSIVSGISSAVSKVIDAVKNLATGIWDTIKSLPGKMLDIGKNIVEGIWKGISGAASWLWDKITGFASDILGGFKSIFGIHSPSTEMEEQGKYLMLGLANGISYYSKKVQGSIQHVADSVNETLSKALDINKSIDLDVSSNLFSAVKSPYTQSCKSPIVQKPESVEYNYTFNSPVAVTPTVAAKLMKQTAQQISMSIK
jgi:TP901 family phage tail tape measure protein